MQKWQKWTIATLCSFIVQSSVVEALPATRQIRSIHAVKNLNKTMAGHDECPCDKQGPPGPVGDQGPQGGGFQQFASYWLTNQPDLAVGQNVLFNLQQTLSGIEYDATTGIFTVPAGVYAITFFATPNSSFENTLNLNVNGTILPTPNLEGTSCVVQFSDESNLISVQATGDWSPQTGDIGSYFFAYASIAIYQIGT